MLFFLPPPPRHSIASSSENLNNPIPSTTDHPPAILTPDDGTDTLAAHDAVGGDFLGARPLLERPEAKGGIVAGRNEFSAVRA